MRTSLMALTSIFFLVLLVTTAHGIRLNRQLHEAIGSEEHGESEASNVVARLSVTKYCTTDGRCGSGKRKKPPAPHAEPGAAATEHQSSKQSRNEKDTTAVVGVTPGIGQQEAAPMTGHGGRQDHQEEPPRQRTAATYPDILDIAGMDYSPAARKPPIHN